MIKFSQTFDQGTVYVKYPQSAAEVQELQNLVQQTKRMCSGPAKTDFWISAEFVVKGLSAVVTSVEKKVGLNSDNLRVLRAELEAKLAK